MTSPARSTVTQAELAGVNGRGLGPDQPIIDADNLDTDLATDANVSALYTADQIKFFSATGVDGDPGPADMTVTGMEAEDVLLAVLDGNAEAQSLTPFAVDAGKLVVTGADLSGFTWLVIYIDVDA